MSDSTAQAVTQDWRDRILSDPEMILEDRDLMRALIAANERAMGQNIVDMRGIAMERLEARLDRLEDTHRSVIAAAYENLAGTNQINRCVLRLLDCAGFGELLQTLVKDLPEILRVDRIRLALESAEPSEAPHAAVAVVPAGFVKGYITQDRDVPMRLVTLRQCAPASAELFGDEAEWIRSEALLKLDLGAGRMPALLAFGSEDPHQFRVNQGTELLTFFTGVFERLAKRHLG
ncbi:DUF484 family protein [Jannaschia sp. M317]|uniref:DUF484 family protein n=1 Tax=Jannaschia sp. M317 TaxID=2867011 RepID=UPI0021A6DB1C|nr:DUF484 family protein [Jannaschia sp. M317]UWQ18770.1 DUF484 family protein [Jannaschia sp. M317]